MGNGTTCNLHLVKQNAKRKGEVSTRFFFLYSVGFSLFFCSGWVGWGDFLLLQNKKILQRLKPHRPLLSSATRAFHQAALWGLLGEKGGTVLGPDLWRQTTATTTGEGGDETSRCGTGRFIYHNSAIALPIPDSQCKCWTFREKITSPGEGAVGEKLSRLQ